MNARGPAARRLFAATAISVAAHAALMSGSWMTMPEAPPEPPPLTARLEPLPPPEKPRPPVLKPRPVARPAPQRQPAAAAPRPAPVDESAAVAAAAMADEPVEAPVAEPAVVASVAPTVFRLPETPPLPDFPRKGRIIYQLTMGPDRTPVGRTVQTWEFDDTQYRLASLSESTGLIELFRPHRYHYLSQGTVSAQGLRPQRFLSSVKRGSRTEEALAEFDWENGRIRLGRVPQQSVADLPAGSQDVISFMYQLAMAPPAPGRIRIPFTRGSRLDTVSFDVLPQETIETPLGQLRTLPVIQVHQNGSESLGVWLAADYRNLPVRIRFFGRDGDVTGEQLVSEIQVGER